MINVQDKLDDYHAVSIELINNDRLPFTQIILYVTQIQIDPTSQLKTHYPPNLGSLTVSRSSIAELE